jgi:hypothetical protein
MRALFSCAAANAIYSNGVQDCDMVLRMLAMQPSRGRLPFNRCACCLGVRKKHLAEARARGISFPQPRDFDVQPVFAYQTASEDVVGQREVPMHWLAEHYNCSWA